jgi:two-component system response regulator NreC
MLSAPTCRHPGFSGLDQRFNPVAVTPLRVYIGTVNLNLHEAGPHERRPAAVTPVQVIRVVLADDHKVVRESLRQLLEREQYIEIVAEASDHRSVALQVDEHRPNVLVLDLRMDDPSSVETISTLGARAPDTRIVVLSMQDGPVFAQHALAAGAIGFVGMDMAEEELPQAIRAAAHGERYVSMRMAARVDALQRALTVNKLSQREVEVLRLIALGHTSVEVAQKLRLSPRTIETHRAHIHTKLGVTTRAELVDYSLRHRLIGA